MTHEAPGFSHGEEVTKTVGVQGHEQIGDVFKKGIRDSDV